MDLQVGAVAPLKGIEILDHLVIGVLLHHRNHLVRGIGCRCRCRPRTDAGTCSRSPAGLAAACGYHRRICQCRQGA